MCPPTHRECGESLNCALKTSNLLQAGSSWARWKEEPTPWLEHTVLHTWGSVCLGRLLSAPLSSGVRQVGTFARISFASQAEQRERGCHCVHFSPCSEQCSRTVPCAPWSAHLAVLFLNRGTKFNITKWVSASQHKCLYMNEVKMGKWKAFWLLIFL